MSVYQFSFMPYLEFTSRVIWVEILVVKISLVHRLALQIIFRLSGLQPFRVLVRVSAIIFPKNISGYKLKPVLLGLNFSLAC
jgi:hypothetical protein